MTRKERLMASLRGEPVDRPAVNFYEIGGFAIDAADPDPYNIYNDPSWQPLIRLAEEESDIIRMRAPLARKASPSLHSELFSTESWEANGSKFIRTTLKIGKRTMSSLSRRDKDVHTTWTLEHLLKDVDDAKAWLELPEDKMDWEYDVSNLFDEEEKLGDKGIVMVEVADPICVAASLFSMEDFTIIAMTEPGIFHAILEKQARPIYEMVRQVSAKFPGRLWRICGAEYATEPYLPPKLFKEYVVRYTEPIVKMITENGGFARIHCHGRLKGVLPYLAEMGASALDPIEPHPQGDVELSYVRKEYGRDMTLFGNIEIADIENMPPSEFEKIAEKALREGTEGTGKGFVLMPTAAPYGRKITATTLANYETMVRLAANFS